jgi:hypothetical protein
MGSEFKRRRLLVDPGFQLRLLLRTGLHLVGSVIVVLHVAFLFEMMMQFLQPGGPRSFLDSYVGFFRRHQFILLGLLLLLPFILYDVLKFSHRLAGPLFRCRRTMQEMALGKPVDEFHPRKHDLMRELFQAFNDLIRRWNAEVAKNTNGNLEHADTKRTLFEETSPVRQNAAIGDSQPGNA